MAYINIAHQDGKSQSHHFKGCTKLQNTEMTYALPETDGEAVKLECSWISQESSASTN